YLAVPMGSVQVNADLSGFAPTTYVDELWPRPVMIVHGLRDEIIPFEQGELLFDAAVEPKRSLWVERAGHNDILEHEGVREAVLRFLAEAEPVPMVQRIRTGDNSAVILGSAHRSAHGRT